MKNKSFDEMPQEVLWVHAMSFLKIPIGASVYIDIAERNPSYFPEWHNHKKEQKAKEREPYDKYYRLKYGL